MTLLNLRLLDRKVLAALRPDEDPFRIFDGQPEPAVVDRIASQTGLDAVDVHYSLKLLKANHCIPTAPLEPLQSDLLTWQIQKTIARLSDAGPLPLFDDNDEPNEGAVIRICQHCAFSASEVRDKLRELREGSICEAVGQ